MSDAGKDSSRAEAPPRRFRSRSAVQARVEQSAEKFVREAKQPAALYRVIGGYEARSLGIGPPGAAHALMATWDARGRRTAHDPRTERPAAKVRGK